MCTRYPIINRVSELKVHIELTRFVQPEKIEIDANERAVNEKSQYCFFVCTTFDSFLNDLCAIPYGRSFYFDVKSGYAAQIISRGKKSDYIRAKYGAAFVSGALIGMIPLVFDFMLTAMVFPMVIPQVGTGTFPVAAMDIMSGVFYTHPLVYNLIFVLIDGCFWGLLNCAVLWAVNFVRSRFWILLTPFIIYIFVFCMVHFVNRVSLSPVMFLRPSAPFRNDIRVVICAFIILIVVNIIFYIHAVKKELVAYE